MKITKVWAVYFSPTGNAKKVVTTMAKRAAECLGVPMGTVDFTLPENREGVVSFDKEDLAFFSTPVYAGRIPNKMLPYVQTAFEGNGALAVAVSVFGNRNFDNGLIELRNELEAHGFHTVAGAGIPTEHVFSSKLATGRPDADDLVKIAEFGEKVAEKVSGLTEIPEKIAVRGDDPVGAYYTGGILKGKTEDGPGEVHEMRNLRDCLSDGIDPEGRAGYLYRNLHQVPGLHQGMSDRSKIF